MRGFRIFAVIMICLVMCISLISCSEELKNGTGIANDLSTEKNAVAFEKSNTQKFDYTHVLKKVWVASDSTDKLYQNTSFRINNIEDMKLEGEVVTGMITPPSYNYYLEKHLPFVGNLAGTINNNILECIFEDDDGNKGTLTLVLKDDDEIEATIKYEEKAEYFKDENLNKTLIFRPYNISDIEKFAPFEDVYSQVDLNSWGTVYFVSGKVADDNKFPVLSYLTNKDGDILYDFSSVVPNNMMPMKVEFVDINHDGLKDMIILIASSIEDTEFWARVLIQEENGSFYNDDKVNAELETLDGITDVESVLDFLNKK